MHLLPQAVVWECSYKALGFDFFWKKKALTLRVQHRAWLSLPARWLMLARGMLFGLKEPLKRSDASLLAALGVLALPLRVSHSELSRIDR